MPQSKAKVVRRLSQLRKESIHWLWKGWLPAGKLALLDGDPGQGKSLITLDLASRFTTGRRLPDGSQPGEPIDVVLLSAEDGLEDTILPRLEAAQADVSRIHIFHGKTASSGERLPIFPDDGDLLRETIQETKARLVILDPLLAFLSARVSSLNDQLVRQVLSLLAEIAEQTGSAVLMTRHLTKGGGRERAIYRGSGSIGFMGAARIAFLAGDDPAEEDSRLLACTKSSLGTLPATLGYRIVADNDGPARIEWTGIAAISAEQMVLAAGHRQGEALRRAVKFLKDLLEQGSCRADEVFRQARLAGIAQRTLERAKSDLQVASEQSGADGKNHWWWRLPAVRDGHDPFSWVEEENRAIAEAQKENDEMMARLRAKYCNPLYETTATPSARTNPDPQAAAGEVQNAHEPKVAGPGVDLVESPAVTVRAASWLEPARPAEPSKPATPGAAPLPANGAAEQSPPIRPMPEPQESVEAQRRRRRRWPHG